MKSTTLLLANIILVVLTAAPAGQIITNCGKITSASETLYEPKIDSMLITWQYKTVCVMAKTYQSPTFLQISTLPARCIDYQPFHSNYQNLESDPSIRVFRVQMRRNKHCMGRVAKGRPQIEEFSFTLKRSAFGNAGSTFSEMETRAIGLAIIFVILSILIGIPLISKSSLFRQDSHND